jgi:hypothetical protein
LSRAKAAGNTFVILFESAYPYQQPASWWHHNHATDREALPRILHNEANAATPDFRASNASGRLTLSIGVLI